MSIDVNNLQTLSPKEFHDLKTQVSRESEVRDRLKVDAHGLIKSAVQIIKNYGADQFMDLQTSDRDEIWGMVDLITAHIMKDFAYRFVVKAYLLELAGVAHN